MLNGGSCSCSSTSCKRWSSFFGLLFGVVRRCPALEMAAPARAKLSFLLIVFSLIAFSPRPGDALFGVEALSEVSALLGAVGDG